MKSTESVQQRITRHSADDKTTRFSTFSFTDDQVMRDARVRVTEALSKAGVLHTTYAQSMLMSMARIRPDAMTSDQRENRH